MSKKILTVLHPNWYLAYIFLLTLLFVGIYFFNMFIPSDFDLGWHLRYGNEVLRTHDLKPGNTYSSEMVGYHWVNTNWGLEIIRYLIYQKFDLVGLSIAGGITLTLACFYLYKTTEISIFEASILLPLFCIAQYPLNYHSFRGQEVSTWFTFLILYFLYQIDKGKWKYAVYTVILLFLWVNIHAQVMIGVVILGIWTAVRLLGQIPLLLKNVHFLKGPFNTRIKTVFSFLLPYAATGFIGLVVTFINPFGLTLYIESLMLPASDATKYVSEWAPLTPNMGVSFYIAVAYGILTLVGMAIALKEKEGLRRLPYFLITLLFLYMGFNQLRYIWTMFIIGSLFIAIILKKIVPRNPKIAIVTGGIITLGFVFFVLVSLMPSRHLDAISWDSYCIITNCSPQGATILSKYFKGKRLWSDYNYGGWLIWNYPDVKPVIDGRMHLWIDPKTKYNPFMDMYLPLEWGKVNPDDSKFDVFFVQNFRPIVKELDKLVEAKKWQLVYKDDHASIYVRLDSNKTIPTVKSK